MTAAAAKKILLVDDDEVLRLWLGEQLRLYEFTTVEVSTGVDALNLNGRSSSLMRTSAIGSQSSRPIAPIS